MSARADDGCVLWTETVGPVGHWCCVTAVPGCGTCSVLEWSAEFEDADRAVDLARATADPWYELNRECSAAVNEDVRAWLPGAEARCRELAVPVLIVDGERDIRPRWAADSLQRALPRVRRVTLAGAGHLPWVEDPAGFRRAVAGFFAATAGAAA